MMAYQKGVSGAEYVISVIHNGKPLREFSQSGKRTCIIPFSSEYQLRIRNKSHRRAMAVVSIDGTDVLTGDRKFVLGPYQTIDLERFVDSLSEGKRFKFVSLEEGIRTGQVQDPTSPINGLIRVQIYTEAETKTSWAMVSDISSGMWRGSSVGHSATNSLSSSVLRSHNISKCIDDVPAVEAFACSAGATAEGSSSTQAFSQGSSFVTEVIPVVLEIWLSGPKQETRPVVQPFVPVTEQTWGSSVPFTVKIKNGSIWLEDGKGSKVYTNYIGIEGDFVRIRTTDFQFANQFERSCMNVTDKGFDLRLYAKDKIVSE